MALGEIRAFQIDLARQIETLESVMRFLDIGAQTGFNMCVLYLEDRIKTASYPYVDDMESYSTEEIHQIVTYAEALGIELVPVVSNLGHTERFLRHSQLEHLAERRGGIAGRFSKAGDTNYNAACPELPEAQTFFDQYITEVAALFPSKYFHVGLDEVFDMGYCALCKPVFEHGGLSELFLRHILHTHELLKRLGKTMMMWDDMFEECPDALYQIPRDIVMCSWFYDYIDRYPDGHFNNRARTNIAALYDKLGIPYLISTSCRVENVESFTRYAEGNYHPLGMFITLWEMSREQLLPLHILVAQAGMLWQGIHPYDPYQRLCEAAALVTGHDEYAPAAAAILSLPSAAYSVRDLLHLMELPQKNVQSMNAQRKQLISLMSPYTDEYAASLRRRVLLPLLINELHTVGYDLFTYRTGERDCNLTELLRRTNVLREAFRNLYIEEQRLWDLYRPNLPSPDLDTMFRTFDDECRAVIGIAGSAQYGEIGRLDIRFCCPDQHGAGTLRASLMYADGSSFEFPARVYKSCDIENNAFFTYTFALPRRETVPVSLTLAAAGYGGVGLTYAEVTVSGSRYLPTALTATEGMIFQCENLLVDDTRTAWLGESEVQYPFRHPGTEMNEASVVLTLTKA